MDDLSFHHLGYSVQIEGGSLAMWPTLDNLIAMAERVQHRAAARFASSHVAALDAQTDFVATELDQFSRYFPFMCAAARQSIADAIDTQWYLARTRQFGAGQRAAY